MSAPPPTVTIGVCTRGRADALARCLGSLALARERVAEVIVMDDASVPPARPQVESRLPEGTPPIRWERVEASRGVAAGRNRIARLARTPLLLNLDDDAFLLDDAALSEAVSVMERDPSVGAVALAQAAADGRPWPLEAQPASTLVPSVIPAFTGYAHLLRREAFLAVGGFLEPMIINGEEKDLCLRLLDAGYRVVYLPDARVGHLAAAQGRDLRRYLHQTVRNEVLSAMHSVPLPLSPVLGIARLLRYFPMRRGWNIHDPGGLRVVLGDIASRLPGVLRGRRPVRWSTLRRWRALTAAPRPYPGPGDP